MLKIVKVDQVTHPCTTSRAGRLRSWAAAHLTANVAARVKGDWMRANTLTMVLSNALQRHVPAPIVHRSRPGSHWRTCTRLGAQFGILSSFLSRRPAGMTGCTPSLCHGISIALQLHFPAQVVHGSRPGAQHASIARYIVMSLSSAKPCSRLPRSP